MKYKLLSVALLVVANLSFAQNKSAIWNASAKKTTLIALDENMQLPSEKVFELNLSGLRSALNSAPKRMSSSQSQNIISIPNADGNLEQFKVFENSIMEAELAARYPEIKSYVGQGIDTPTATIYVSLSPLGLQTMVIKADQSAEFIEPYTTDKSSYAVYKKSDKKSITMATNCWPPSPACRRNGKSR